MKVKDYLKDDVVYPMVINTCEGEWDYREMTGKQISEEFGKEDCSTIAFAYSDADARELFEENGHTASLVSEVVIFSGFSESGWIAIED